MNVTIGTSDATAVTAPMNVIALSTSNVQPVAVGGNTYGGLKIVNTGTYYIEGSVNVEENNASQDLGATIVKLVKTTATNTYLSAGRTKVTGSTMSQNCSAKVFWCGDLNANDILALYTFASATNQHYIRFSHLYIYRLS